MTNLVIVESPAKCQKIQGFLGPGWRVIASMGHIRALEETLDAIGLDRDFEPKYQFIKEFFLNFGINICFQDGA